MPAERPFLEALALSPENIQNTSRGINTDSGALVLVDGLTTRMHNGISHTFQAKRQNALTFHFNKTPPLIIETDNSFPSPAPLKTAQIREQGLRSEEVAVWFPGHWLSGMLDLTEQVSRIRMNSRSRGSTRGRSAVSPVGGRPSILRGRFQPRLKYFVINA